MKHLINSTGRKTINLENITVRLEDGGESFKAQVTILENLQLNRNARVYMEAYVGSSLMRFNFGTVGRITHPDDTTLTELDAGRDVLFRLRVVDESGHIGKILAAANGIRPRYEADESIEQRSLLPLVSLDLGEELWRVSVHGEAIPVLQINNRVLGLREKLLTDAVLQGSIYPYALRTILNHILSDNSGDGEIGWIKDWKAFTKDLHDLPWPEEEEDRNEDTVEDFIDTTVKSYCDHLKLATKAKSKAESALNE